MAIVMENRDFVCYFGHTNAETIEQAANVVCVCVVFHSLSPPPFVFNTRRISIPRRWIKGTIYALGYRFFF